MELERRAVYFHGFGEGPFIFMDLGRRVVIYFQGSREQETFGAGLG